ncbi:sugar-transfer associated ATP-grasp domain-containing protein [Butyrivibrio sp. AE2005]|uniref:sugar-transfer associated ATP-grasp domain-containing protein n=1 Tax=Butyrivibrio sp. AE2005 TaxID=1496722 RepID=UPI00047ABFF0|nr:sugar-transfer associated ATP-grasp domain-containing protein [Butyrivibrio sp. AE2005]
MNMLRKIELECVAVPLVFKGIPHQIGRKWYWQVRGDKKKHYEEYNLNTIRYWRKRGYLSTSVARWGLSDKHEVDYISDFEYCCLTPINSDFSKWLTDMLTTQRVMLPAGKHFRNIYFSIIQREGRQLILKKGQEDREYTISDLLDFIRQKGDLELRPSWWNSNAKRYALSYKNDETEKYFCNEEEIDAETIEKIINDLRSNYILADVVPVCFDFGGTTFNHALKFWVANDFSPLPQIMAAEIWIYEKSDDIENIKPFAIAINLDKGTFVYQNKTLFVPNWNQLKKDICCDAQSIPQLAFYSTSIAINNSREYTYLRFSGNPTLPKTCFGDELNKYLKNKYDTQFKKNTAKEQLAALGRKIRSIEQRTFCRKGMRPFMYGLWRTAARDDMFHTKGVSLPKKFWAHRHGFFSWRLYQYGLTKDNYSNFLSDYDYYWLNRINNHYQIWVNDKTTFRYVMEPFKEFIPQYFFSVYKRSGKTVISKMWDCPNDVPHGFDGVLEMLKKKGKLAFKASAGAHGDGFYCLEYENEILYANGEQISKSSLESLIMETKSFYVITEYLEMHSAIKKIYPKSVNTVRMMVINDHGYDPRILQTYMRIGAGDSGYTDNVGYGGICAFVDIETGKIFQPEQLKDHRYIPCDNHPDTGCPISGYIPDWKNLKKSIKEICKYLCELEYLGFDIAVTEDGFKILEINIHQDLHKVATFNNEINDFFRRKIIDKKMRYSIKPLKGEKYEYINLRSG